MPQLPPHGQRFDLQSRNYGRVSSVQDLLAERLWDSLAPRLCPPIGIALDVGAGTGHLSLRIAKAKPASLHLLDLSAAMLATAAERMQQTFPQQAMQTIQEDAEHWNPGEERYALIASSAAIQWLAHLDTFLLRSRQWLLPNGLLALASFGPASLHELQQAYLQTTGSALQAGTRMRNQQELVDMVQSAGFSPECAHSETVKVPYASPRELLRSLKNMGVTGSSPGQPLRRKQALELDRQLGIASQGADQQYYLSWELVWLVARIRSK